MHKVTSDNIDNSKSDFVVTTEPAASISINAGEVGIYVGETSMVTQLQQSFSTTKACINRLRERSFPNGPLIITLVIGDIPSQTVSEVLNFPFISNGFEDGIVIAYESSFYPGGNSTNWHAHLTRMLERLREDVGKFS